MVKLALLRSRGVVEIVGEDRVAFLQGLVSNDVAEVAPGRAVWAALLSPQGKWLADFFILGDGERLLLDCERDGAAALAQRLARYRLRAQVRLRDASEEFAVHAAWEDAAGGDGPALAWDGAVTARDPRLPDAGWRILAAGELPTNADAADWNRHRLALGLPDGTRDLETDKTILLEAGFDELNGVSWTKGCYMGQELTARTKYRGLLKRRLVPVRIDGALPPPGTPVLDGGSEIGTMRSGDGNHGLAVLRLDALARPGLTAGGARVTPAPASWMALPAAADTPAD